MTLSPKMLVSSLALMATATSVSAGYADSQHIVPGWRGDTNAVHIGWDLLEPNGFPPPIGDFGGVLLDDTTPDIGDVGISGARFQQVGTTFGHVSSTGNYYSGFGDGWGADDVITAPTDTTDHAGGYTTVIFQFTEQDLGGAPPAAGETDPTANAGSFDRTDITLNGVAPLVENFARGVNANGVSQWFAQWEVLGDPTDVQVAFSNDLAHTAIDFVEVDVLWSASGGQLATTPVIVPEPASVIALGLGGLMLMRRRRG